MDLGRSIKISRKKAGLTQKELAVLALISPMYLSQVERNEKTPNFSTLEKIAISLNTSVPSLFFQSLDKEDIVPDKWQFFEEISPLIQKIIV